MLYFPITIQRLSQSQKMETLFLRQKPFLLKMAACWKLRIEMLYWRALVQLMYMINGLHLQDLVHARKHDTSMEQLLLMTRCIYLVEITMDVTLMIFRLHFISYCLHTVRQGEKESIWCRWITQLIGFLGFL